MSSHSNKRKRSQDDVVIEDISPPNRSHKKMKPNGSHHRHEDNNIKKSISDDVRKQLDDLQDSIDELMRKKRELEIAHGLISSDHAQELSKLDQLVFKTRAHSCECCHESSRLTQDTKCKHEVCKHCVGVCAVCKEAICDRCGTKLECERCVLEMWACTDSCAFSEEEGDTKIPRGCPECGFEMSLTEPESEDIDEDELEEDARLMREEEEEVDDDFERHEDHESDEEEEMAFVVDENEEEDEDDDVQIVG